MGDTIPSDDEARGQDTVSLDSLPYMPATVNAHTIHNDGMTLHTIGDDHATDIRLYNDGTPAHRISDDPDNQHD